MHINYTWQAHYGRICFTMQSRLQGGFTFEFTDSTTGAKVNEYTEETDTERAQAIGTRRARELLANPPSPR